MLLVKRGHLCNHPEQYPYNPYTGEKNEPCEVNSCECGANYICPKCGWGACSFPHTCKKEELT